MIPIEEYAKCRGEGLAKISAYKDSSDSEEGSNNKNISKEHRSQSVPEFDSDSDDSESELSPFLQTDSEEEDVEAKSKSAQQKPSSLKIKARGELDIDDLPPIEELKISVEEDQCIAAGKVHSIVDKQVCIESTLDLKPLNLDSVIFDKKGKPLGQIFDVFGSVLRPYYTLRFNNKNEIESKNLSVGTTVYCAPKTEHTKFVELELLLGKKGCDASWVDDVEPPEAFAEFSDDDEERFVKKASKGKKVAGAMKFTNAPKTSQRVTSFEQRMNYQNTIRNKFYCPRPATPKTRPDWFKNAAPGAGRPRPQAPVVRGSIIRESNFNAPPPLLRPTSSIPPSSGSPSFSFNQPHPSTNNNPSLPGWFSTFISGSAFSSQDQIKPKTFNSPHSAFSANSQGFGHNGQGYGHNLQGFGHNSQGHRSNESGTQPLNFPSHNTFFNSPPPPPFQLFPGGGQPNNQPFPFKNEVFGGPSSFPNLPPHDSSPFESPVNTGRMFWRNQDKNYSCTTNQGSPRGNDFTFNYPTSSSHLTPFKNEPNSPQPFQQASCSPMFLKGHPFNSPPAPPVQPQNKFQYFKQQPPPPQNKFNFLNQPPQNIPVQPPNPSPQSHSNQSFYPNQQHEWFLPPK